MITGPPELGKPLRRPARRRTWSKFSTLLLCLSAELRAQDAAREARDRSLSKTRAQLERRPTHGPALDHYFKLLVESNAVESEVKLLETKLSKEAGETTTSIILGKRACETWDRTPGHRSAGSSISLEIGRQPSAVSHSPPRVKLSARRRSASSTDPAGRKLVSEIQSALAAANR